MPPVSLQLHPDSTCDAIVSIDVDVSVVQNQLRLHYRFAGDRSRLLLPPRSSSARADLLWRTTCCEAFLGHAAASDYLEFNFAPSTHWAAYRFSGYRRDMLSATLPAPNVLTTDAPQPFSLQAVVHFGAPLTLTAYDRLGLACVLEETGGRLSYWALWHPTGKPDFHDPSALQLDLASYAS